MKNTQEQLTTEQIPDFLQKLAREGRFSFMIEEILSCEEIKTGNNNYLWQARVKTPTGILSMFVKQAWKWNRRAYEQGKETRVDPARIHGEHQMIRFLRELWGKEYVPEIYYFDPERHIIVLSDVSRGGELLSTKFEHDEIHPELGGVLGMLFGKLHASTYNSPVECCGSDEWREKMRWLFETHFATGVRKFVAPELVDKFYKEAREAALAWIWGDPVHRNIFVHPVRNPQSVSVSHLAKDGCRLTPSSQSSLGGLTAISNGVHSGGGVSMVDFDHAHRYDPACDCGFLLAHWIWMGLKAQNEKRKTQNKLQVESKQFQNDFWLAYEREFATRNLAGEFAHIKPRAMRWAGLYLVSRTDGASGSYFAYDPEWEQKIREKGVVLFNKQI